MVDEFGEDLYDEIPIVDFFEAAARHGQNEVIGYFIEQGIDVKKQGGDSFVRAAEEGNTHTAKYLLEQGADIHYKDDSALKWAAFHGKTDTVKFLVEHGADIHSQNQDALRYSSKNGHTEIAIYLIDKGCDPKVAKELGTTEVTNAICDHEREKFAARLQFKVPQAKKASQSRLKI